MDRRELLRELRKFLIHYGDGVWYEDNPEDLIIDETKSIVDLGGDALDALNFAMLLEEKTGIEIPDDVALGPIDELFSYVLAEIKKVETGPEK